MDTCIRFVRPGEADAKGILAVYAPFVRDTAITFEYDVPSAGTFAERISGIAATYPYLVCERDGEVLAYAYAARHMERAAYAWDVQTSVYAAPEVQGTGMARALYAALFALLARLGYVNAYAIITLPNPKSIRFHESFGFGPAGVHHNAGYKGGAWHTITWMEKPLAPPAQDPVPPRPVAALAPDESRRIFASCLVSCHL